MAKKSESDQVGGGLVQTVVDLHADECRALEMAAGTTGQTASELVRAALRAFLGIDGPPGAGERDVVIRLGEEADETLRRAANSAGRSEAELVEELICRHLGSGE